LKGQAYDGLGHYSRAIEEFEVARKEQPADATVRFSLGFMYWKVRRYQEAEVELMEALKLDRHFEEAKFYLADTYLTDQKPAKALPILEMLARSDPHNIRVHLNLGKALEKLNRNEEAVLALQTALRLDPNRAEAHYQLARVYQKLKRTDEFHRELEISQRLQKQKLEEEESLLKASGSRGDPTQSLGLVPSRLEGK
jgi:tetratricopeptide (TPR) repeat protein